MSGVSKAIVQPLLSWYDAGHRDLPWRSEPAPYRVWVSEIMLQQTRVEAVRGYFSRWMNALPDIPALAAADEAVYTKLWEGLGYYSRVRNLHRAAVLLCEEYGGELPADYDRLLALPGVGEYTAGAVASIAFGLPVPAVDGNVLRVLSRVMEDGAPVTNQKTKTAYREALLPLYEAGPRGTLTQALMELGAMVCVPNGAPKCESCPLQELCLANAYGTWEKYPVKEAKKAKREEEKTVFYLTCDGCLAVRKRESRGLLAGLWELPNVEGKLDAAQALSFAEKAGCEPAELLKSVERVHVFTHIIWRMRCYYIVCKEKSPEFVWASDARRKTDVALPTAFRMFVEEEI